MLPYEPLMDLPEIAVDLFDSELRDRLGRVFIELLDTVPGQEVHRRLSLCDLSASIKLKPVLQLKAIRLRL